MVIYLKDEQVWSPTILYSDGRLFHSLRWCLCLVLL
jgi:hypothetical protein